MDLNLTNARPFFVLACGSASGSEEVTHVVASDRKIND